MLHCPGRGQELLAAFGVTIVCHDSNVFHHSQYQCIELRPSDFHKIKFLKRVKQTTTNTLHKAFLDPYLKKSYNAI